MKLAFKALLGVFAALIVIVLVAPYFIDLNSYKTQIIETAEEKSGLKLTVDGDLVLSILPSPSFSISDVTVSETASENSEPVISFKRLNVNVDLIPLFSGDISVNSISIDDPIIKVQKNKDGSLNLSNLLKNSNTESDDAKGSIENKNEQTASLPNISFNLVRIKNGVVHYKDASSNDEKVIRNINMEVSASNLTGPFSSDGSLFYDGYGIDFELQTDKYNADEKNISPKVKLNIEPLGLGVNFSGALSLQNPSPMLQGHAEFTLKDLSKVADMQSAQKSLKVTGILSANSEKLSLSNMNGSLGNNEFSGAASFDLKSMSPKISLKTADKLNISDFGVQNTPYKTVSFDINASGDASMVRFDKTALTLDSDTYIVSGKYNIKDQKLNLDVKTKSVNLDKLMGDSGEGKTKQSGSSFTGSPNTTSNSVTVIPSVPLNIDVSFLAEKVLYSEKNATNVSLAVSANGNKINIKDFSVGDYIGSSVKANLSSSNINSLDGLDVYLDVNSKDAKGLLNHFGVDTLSLPKAVNSGNVKLKASGNKDTLDLTTNISALGGEFIAKGRVEALMKEPSVKNLVIQLKHKNMANLLNLLTGAKINDANLSKPIDLYTEINQNGKSYSLTKLKGDLSGATVHGNLNLNLSNKVPSIDGSLEFGELRMQSVVEAKGGSSKSSASSGSSSSAPKTSARWSKEIINASALHSVNLDLDLKAKKIQYGTWPLLNPSVKLLLKDGDLSIKGLKAGVFGGDVAMDASVKSVAQARQPVHFTSESRFNNVDIGSLATSLIGTKLVKVTGRGDLNLNIDSSGASSAALIHDLSGGGVVDAKNIVLDGVDVVRFVRALSDESKPGDTVLGLWKGTTKGGQTQFDTLDGAFSIKGGVVNLEKMDLDGPRAAIQTRGSINLPNWTLATKHKLIAKGTEEVPSDIPPFEITFNGSLDNPAQTFGQGLLQDYLNRKLQRKFNSLLSDQLGLPSNDNKPQNNIDEVDQKQQQPKQKQPEPEDVMEDVLKGVLGDLLR